MAANPREYRARFDNIRARISQECGRIKKRVNDAMEREAEQIRDDARKLAPLDEGYLEAAIKVESLEGRTAWAVYIDRDAMADDGVTVGSYAIRLHEAADGEVNWGPKTLAKPGVGGERPGAKFLERAYKMHIKGFAARMRGVAEQKG